jgi:hypothetical protein
MPCLGQKVRPCRPGGLDWGKFLRRSSGRCCFLGWRCADTHSRFVGGRLTSCQAYEGRRPPAYEGAASDLRLDLDRAFTTCGFRHVKKGGFQLMKEGGFRLMKEGFRLAPGHGHLLHAASEREERRKAASDNRRERRLPTYEGRRLPAHEGRRPPAYEGRRLPFLLCAGTQVTLQQHNGI